MGAPFVYRMPVRFADVDHAGIVYYPLFYHYFHKTFEEFFIARLGAKAYVRLLDEERVGFPAVSCSCDFKSPLKFGDFVDIEMSLDNLGGRSITCRYRAYRVEEDSEERVLAAEGVVTSAVVDLCKFRAMAVPEPMRVLFESINSGALEA